MRLSSSRLRKYLTIWLTLHCCDVRVMLRSPREIKGVYVKGRRETEMERVIKARRTGLAGCDMAPYTPTSFAAY